LDGRGRVVRVAVRLFVVYVAAEGEGPGCEAAGVGGQLVAQRRALRRGGGERVRRGGAGRLVELLWSGGGAVEVDVSGRGRLVQPVRSEEHTSELQSREN